MTVIYRHAGIGYSSIICDDELCTTGYKYHLHVGYDPKITTYEQLQEINRPIRYVIKLLNAAAYPAVDQTILCFIKSYLGNMKFNGHNTICESDDIFYL